MYEKEIRIEKVSNGYLLTWWPILSLEKKVFSSSEELYNFMMNELGWMISLNIDKK